MGQHQRARPRPPSGPTAWTTFGNAEKAWAYRQDQLPSTHPIVADIRDLEDVEVNFDGITYAKGASVLKQLVAWVGQEAFVAGLRALLRASTPGATPSSRDLLAELEETSGRDLSAWAPSVAGDRPGSTRCGPRSTVDDDGRHHGRVDRPDARRRATRRCARTASPSAATTCVDGRAGAHATGSSWTSTATRTEVPELVGRPRPDLLLVNDDDLAYAKIRLDERSLATAVAHLARLRRLAAPRAGAGARPGT